MSFKPQASLLALLFAVPVLATWSAPGVPGLYKILSLTFLAVSAARPVWGLYGLAGLLPLAAPLQLLLGGPFGGAEVAEMMVAPWVAAASARAALGRDGVNSRLAVPALLFALLCLASGTVQLLATPDAIDHLGGLAAMLWTHAREAYYVDPMPYDVLHQAMGWAEALALVVFVESALRNAGPARIRAAIHLVLAGATGSAAFSAFRLAEISLRANVNHPLAAAVSFLSTVRFHPFFDWNAAGSYYALALVPLLWLGITGAWRWAWAAAPVVALALWCTGSRAAILASLIAFAAIAFASGGRTLRWVVAAATAVSLVLALVASVRPEATQADAAEAIDIRLAFIPIALHVAAEHPLFGVGLGQFRRTSIPFVSADLARRFPVAARGENAHNNFLQILAELGATGLVTMCWLIGRLTMDVTRAIRTATIAPEALALAGGVLAFLISCLGGHPLLVTLVLFPFFLTFGVAAGATPAGESAPARRGRRLARWIPLAFAGFIVLSIPVRAYTLRRATNLDFIVSGASEIVGTLDGVPYRRADDTSRWYFAGDARHLAIPLRLSADSSSSCRVAIALDGRPADEVVPVRDGWRVVTFALNPPRHPPASRDLELVVRGDGCRLLVGTLTSQ